MFASLLPSSYNPWEAVPVGSVSQFCRHLLTLLNEEVLQKDLELTRYLFWRYPEVGIVKFATVIKPMIYTDVTGPLKSIYGNREVDNSASSCCAVLNGQHRLLIAPLTKYYIYFIKRNSCTSYYIGT